MYDFLGNIIITGTMTGQIIFLTQKDMTNIVYDTSYSSYIEDLYCLNGLFAFSRIHDIIG